MSNDQISPKEKALIYADAALETLYGDLASDDWKAKHDSAKQILEVAGLGPKGSGGGAVVIQFNTGKESTLGKGLADLQGVLNDGECEVLQVGFQSENDTTMDILGDDSASGDRE